MSLERCLHLFLADEVSDYLSEIFGDDYEDRLSDHESLTNLNRPLASLDMVMARAASRLKDKDSGRFRSEVAKRVEQVSRDHSEMMVAKGQGDHERLFKHATKLTKSIDALREYCSLAVEDLQAEKSFVEIVERVSRNMGEAWKIKLSAANVLSQAEVSRVMGRIVAIITETLPKESAQAVVSRIRSEVFVDKMRGAELEDGRE